VHPTVETGFIGSIGNDYRGIIIKVVGRCEQMLGLVYFLLDVRLVSLDLGLVLKKKNCVSPTVLYSPWYSV
jgi:hypothetical protein